jgi:ParB/RepB/Spo0J family partition protein
METIELSALDLRLEHTRRKDSEAQRRLLSSIIEHDIREPLVVSACDTAHRYVLLDGFKRFRCAVKLGMSIVPVQCIAQDVPSGVSALFRRTSAGALSTMEEAALIEQLYKKYNLTIYDISVSLERSPTWVSLRLGMISELSDLVRNKIMSGAFPARAYMYGIKSFTRVNKVSQELIDAFVTAVSGKGLSTRNLDTLSRAYFCGGAALRQLVDQGNVRRALAMIAVDTPMQRGKTKDDRDRFFALELKAVATALHRIITDGAEASLSASPLRQDINLWSGEIQKHLEAFTEAIKRLHDRSGPTVSGADTTSSGCAS